MILLEIIYKIKKLVIYHRDKKNINKKNKPSEICVKSCLTIMTFLLKSSFSIFFSLEIFNLYVTNSKSYSCH